MDNFQKAQRHNINARVRQIDQAIKSLRNTIDRVGQAREMPGVSIAQFEAQIEKLVAEKVELTGALNVQDAVVDANEDREIAPVQEERKRTDSTQQREAFTKPGKTWRDYKYEELFHENIDGDMILTFPDEILKETGWKEGDILDFEVVAGSLHIRKKVDISKLK